MNELSIYQELTKIFARNMEQLSIFDIYKIGVGPSSSHTLGPWKAARAFLLRILKEEKLPVLITIDLYGSLSKTGKGHGTDIAIILGLQDFDPTIIDTSRINQYVKEVENNNCLKIDNKEILFSPKEHIIFNNYSIEKHPNTLSFKATYENGKCIEETYYSVGGGFIEKEGQNNSDVPVFNLPYNIQSAADLISYTKDSNKMISDIVHENELVFQPEEEVKIQLRKIHRIILECVYAGCHTSGTLPGGLEVKRRAQEMASSLLPPKKHDTENMVDWLNHIKNTDSGFSVVNKWVSCFALAVNEENAAFGRVVTSPTNGAAGVIPAVLFYYICFCEEVVDRAVERFFYTSGIIGALFKTGATISAAMGGCQAEIGVSSAMAAAGLAEVMGGNPKQVLMAAEIAMEHHLGLTCDPIGGLVQIPCIERNAMGAVKAITAANIALSSDADRAKVSLDAVIKTMWETAQDMNYKYKETAEGGLAINLPVIQPSC